MREYSNNEGLTARAEKFVDLSIMNPDDYSWSEQDDRIELKIGDYYWHREEMYVLSLLGSNIVQWKQLGYAWYLGSCIDPYAEVLPVVLINDNRKSLPYYETYTKAGGTDAVTPENYRILNDTVAYTCLTEGMYWGGSPYEDYPLKNTAIYHAPSKIKDPGDDMSVSMATSFIGYLSDKYGFDKVSDFCFSDRTFNDAFGTDYQTEYDSWSEWILNTYGA